MSDSLTLDVTAPPLPTRPSPTPQPAPPRQEVAHAAAQSSPARSVFLALPTYGEPVAGAVRALYVHASGRRGTKLIQVETKCSLLAQSFNIAWCQMLNHLEGGHEISHFAMLHSDIEPDSWRAAADGRREAVFWVDELLDEMDATGADVLSAVSPIKDGRGLTSCGVARPDGDPWSPLFRLTMRQVMALPETFGAADMGHPEGSLLVNTACWAVRISRDWVFDFPGFTINDRLVRVDARGPDGVVRRQWRADVEPEDWFASRWFNRRGLRVRCTRKVKLGHHGKAVFPNHENFGDHDFDRDLNTDAARMLSSRLGLSPQSPG